MNIRFLGLFMWALLSGCSTIYVHDPVQNDVVKPLALSWCVKSSSEMNKLNETLSDAENKKVFEMAIRQAISDVEKSVGSEASGGARVSIADAPKCLDAAEEASFDSGLYLYVEISGYGAIKKKWKRILIGTGAVEAVIQGVVVGAATTPWVGVAVAAEEMGSEYLTWNGVDWLLGETYAPVTLEAQLEYKKRIVWQDSYFVTENEDALRSLSDYGNRSEQGGKSSPLVRSFSLNRSTIRLKRSN